MVFCLLNFMLYFIMFRCRGLYVLILLLFVINFVFYNNKFVVFSWCLIFFFDMLGVKLL